MTMLPGLMFGLAALILVSCSDRQPKQERYGIPLEAIELASKHGAVSDWQELLGKNYLTKVFTVDLERELVERPNGKPILLVGQVEDVFRRHGRKWVRLWQSGLWPWWPEIDFEVTCSEETLAPVLEHRGRFVEFAVVVSVTQVRKLRLRIEAVADESEAAYVELTESERFVALGEYLAFVKITSRKP